MNRLLNPETIAELLNVQEETCLSLYMPTHKTHPANSQDVSKFKELVKELKEILAETLSESDVQAFLKPYYKLAEDYVFWQHADEGLAILSTKNKWHVFRLESSVGRLAVVADSFHTKPLRKYLQTLERYQVLGLTSSDVKFYEGNRHSLVEVELAGDVPATIKDALGEQFTQKYLSISGGGAGPGGTGVHHGHGSKSDEVEKDTERYFTVVARAVEEHYSNPSGLPLILAALPEHHNVFQRVSNNSRLLKKGIRINPKSTSIEKLKELTWEVIEPRYFERLEKLADKFNQAKANGLGSDTLAEIAKATVEGRVDTLLIENERVIAGSIDRNTGDINLKETSRQVDDLLDDIGELVTLKSGKVMIVPVDKMPTFTGIAAIFRF